RALHVVGAFGRARRDRPRPGETRRFEPAVGDREEPARGALVLEEERARVDRAEERSLAGAPEDGLAVREHEERRPRGEEELRRVVPESTASGALPGFERSERRLEAIAGDRALTGREVGADDAEPGVALVARGR